MGRATCHCLGQPTWTHTAHKVKGFHFQPLQSLKHQGSSLWKSPVPQKRVECYPPTSKLYLGESHFFEVAPSLFKPPSQKDAPAFYKTRRQEVPHLSCHHHSGRSGFWPGGSPRGGAVGAAFLPTPAAATAHHFRRSPSQHKPNTKRTSYSQPPRTHLAGFARTHLGGLPLPSRRTQQQRSSAPPAQVWNPALTNHREIYSSRAVPLAATHAHQGHGREEWRGQDHACALS